MLNFHTTQDCFLEELDRIKNTVYTDNGHIAYKSFEGALKENLFFFSFVDRFKQEEEVLEYFKKAYAENAVFAIANLCYCRDIKGGKGLKEAFKACLEFVYDSDKQIFVKLFLLSLESPSFRADDFLQVIAEKKDFELAQIAFASRNKCLVAKWLPTKTNKRNKSNAPKYAIRQFFARANGLKVGEWDKEIRKARKKLHLIETGLCQNKPFEISKIPSLALNRYAEQIERRFPMKWEEYQNGIKTGKIQVKTNGLDLPKLSRQIKESYNEHNELTLLQALAELPTIERQILPIIDVSGSMTGWGEQIAPIDVALLVGVALAEKADFGQLYMTFSSTPQLGKLEGNDYFETFNKIVGKDDNCSTDLLAVFEYVKQIIGDEPCPELVIISDMEINQTVSSRSRVNLETSVRSIFGYMPKIVFWNVNANKVLVQSQHGITYMTGDSQAVIENMLKGNFPNGLEAMLEVLEKYINWF